MTIRIYVEGNEELFFGGYGVTLMPGRNELDEIAPRMKRIVNALPAARLLGDEEAWPGEAPIRQPELQLATVESQARPTGYVKKRGRRRKNGNVLS